MLSRRLFMSITLVRMVSDFQPQGGRLLNGRWQFDRFSNGKIKAMPSLVVFVGVIELESGGGCPGGEHR